MKAEELKHDQRSPEWFAARCGSVTASSVSKVLATIKTGEAAERRNYRAKLVVERLTGKPAEAPFTNAAMERGTELEPFARMAYESKTGNLVIESGFWSLLGEIGASPDGLIGDDGLLEIKCPSLATHLQYLKAGVMPSEYIPQVQMQLWVTDRQWCDFVSYAPEFPENLQLFILRVQRDEDYINKLKTEVAKFLIEVSEEVQSLSRIAA
jgi:putative phage-type endonuclease